MLGAHLLTHLTEATHEFGRGLQHGQPRDALVALGDSRTFALLAEHLKRLDVALGVNLQTHLRSSFGQLDGIELRDVDPRPADSEPLGIRCLHYALDVLRLHATVHHSTTRQSGSDSRSPKSSSTWRGRRSMARPAISTRSSSSRYSRCCSNGTSSTNRDESRMAARPPSRQAAPQSALGSSASCGCW